MLNVDHTYDHTSDGLYNGSSPDENVSFIHVRRFLKALSSGGYETCWKPTRKIRKWRFEFDKNYKYLTKDALMRKISPKPTKTSDLFWLLQGEWCSIRNGLPNPMQNHLPPKSLIEKRTL